MKQSLNLNFSQQLSLTPQLKQSLKLLQLSSLDLEQEIQIALDSNPLLERVEKDTSIPNDAPGWEGSSGSTVKNGAEMSPTIGPVNSNDIPQPIAEAADPSYEISRSDHLEAEQKLDVSWQETLESQRLTSSDSKSSETNSDFSDTQIDVSGQLAQQETLFEHLSWQVQMTSLSAKDKSIADTLLHSLDEDGYLTQTPEEITALYDSELEVEADEVNAVLSLIKTLDPIGVGAKNLQERLSILINQHAPQTEGLELAQRIIDSHLDLLASKNLSKLRKLLQVKDQELNKSLTLITALNPRVSSRFSNENRDHVVPDIIVRRVANKWGAHINPENQTRLRTNQTYTDLLKKELDGESNQYIQQNLAQAKMFIKSLMSRYDTLLLVAQTIVDRQHDFFEQGPEHMKPMVLQDIAQQLDLHESTVSRATAGKYLTSARGVYELKYFFSSALASVDGTVSSSTAIRSLIKGMVERESKLKPLSDNKIAKELEEQGHIVARRTVAKYRESMLIAPSSQRKLLP